MLTKLHPIVEDTFYYAKPVTPIFKFIGAIPIGNHAHGQVPSHDGVKESLQAINAALHAQKSILLYPAG